MKTSYKQEIAKTANALLLKLAGGKQAFQRGNSSRPKSAAKRSAKMRIACKLVGYQCFMHDGKFNQYKRFTKGSKV